MSSSSYNICLDKYEYAIITSQVQEKVDAMLRYRNNFSPIKSNIIYTSKKNKNY